MKKILLGLLLLCLTVPAFADEAMNITPEAPPVITGWGPSVVGSVGAFYFNGNYSLLNTGVFFGSAYTWSGRDVGVSNAGLYLGPHSQLVNGVSSTSIDILAYLNLYQTSAGGFGVGLGTRFWQSGVGMALRQDTTFLALGYKF